MGFCRRCGDLVSSDNERCKKCGGLPVAGAVRWPAQGSGKVSDRWERTYLSKTSGPSSAASSSANTPTRTQSPTVPSSTASAPSGAGVEPEGQTSHILESADGTLSKLAGTLLSPPSSTTTPLCHSCSSPFPPNSTLYIHPHDSPKSPTARTFCHSCYTSTFSKGPCGGCGRPVLGEAKTEGGRFVEAGGEVWHAKCFKCDGCGTSLHENPMVDMQSRPCCADCFDTSAQRSMRRPYQDRSAADLANDARPTERDRRRLDPTLRDLHRRLDLPPPPEETSELSPTPSSVPTLSPALSDAPSTASNDSRPSTPETRHTLDTPLTPRTAERLHGLGYTRVSARDAILKPQFTGTKNIGSTSAPNSPSRHRFQVPLRSNAPTEGIPSRGRTTSFDVVEEICKECKESLLPRPGQTVAVLRVPGEGAFHRGCLKCGVCEGQLGVGEKAEFVKLPGGGVGHPECAPLKTVTYSRPRTESLQSFRTPPLSLHSSTNSPLTTTPPGSSRPATHATLTPSPSGSFRPSHRPSPSLPSNLHNPSARTTNPTPPKPSIFASRARPIRADAFGGMNHCAGCGGGLTALEGVPGPAGSRWHKRCLKCGGCSKALDSGAKVGPEGNVWCRNCFDTHVSRARPLSYQFTGTSTTSSTSHSSVSFPATPSPTTPRARPLSYQSTGGSFAGLARTPSVRGPVGRQLTDQTWEGERLGLAGRLERKGSSASSLSSGASMSRWI